MAATALPNAPPLNRLDAAPEKAVRHPAIPCGVDVPEPGPDRDFSPLAAWAWNAWFAEQARLHWGAAALRCGRPPRAGDLGRSRLAGAAERERHVPGAALRQPAAQRRRFGGAA